MYVREIYGKSLHETRSIMEYYALLDMMYGEIILKQPVSLKYLNKIHFRLSKGDTDEFNKIKKILDDKNIKFTVEYL